MKRYVALIIIVFLAMIVRNFYTQHMNETRIVDLNTQVDSLKNVVYFYESKHVKFEINMEKSIKTACDSMNLEIKANDSAIFSHGKQVRWLQWHVERLREKMSDN